MANLKKSYRYFTIIPRQLELIFKSRRIKYTYLLQMASEPPALAEDIQAVANSQSDRMEKESLGMKVMHSLERLVD